MTTRSLTSANSPLVDRNCTPGEAASTMPANISQPAHTKKVSSFIGTLVDWWSDLSVNASRPGRDAPPLRPLPGPIPGVARPGSKLAEKIFIDLTRCFL